MSFFDEINDVKNAEVKESNYITEAGAYTLKITGYKMSPENYTGKPYVDFDYKTTEGQIGNIRMFRATAQDSDEVKGYKNGAMKSLMEAGGSDPAKTGKEYVDGCLQFEISAMFREEEYSGYHKGAEGDPKNGMPVLKTIVKYAFCAGKGQTMQAKEAYKFKALNAKAKKKYEYELENWLAANGDPDGDAKTIDEIGGEGIGVSTEIGGAIDESVTKPLVQKPEGEYNTPSGEPLFPEN